MKVYCFSTSLCASVFIAALLQAEAIQAPRNSKISGLLQRENELGIPRGGKVILGKKPEEAPKVSGGSASVPNEIFNLVKSIVGAGVLGLPAGIAAFGTSGEALIPNVALILGIGTLSAYGFSLVGRICAYTDATSYREAWEKSVSSKSGWMPALACFLVTIGSVLAYSMILSDTIPQLLKAFTGIVITRTQALLSLTTFVLLPLCLMKDLSSLGPFSLLGIIGMAWVTLAMTIRFFDGTYAPGGKFYEQLAPEFIPSFEKMGLMDMVTNPNIFLVVSMLATAFMAHYNAPKFYWELENNTLSRFNLVVVVSFAISCLLFVGISSLGFATFGKASAGLILNNYSTDDMLMSLSRVAVAVSLIFSYPLGFVGVRDGLLDLMQVEKEKRTNKLLDVLTVGLLAMVTGLAFVVKDLGKVLALAGSTWGNCLVYLFPTYMFIRLSKSRPELQGEVPQAVMTAVIGLFMGVIGTVMAIKK